MTIRRLLGLTVVATVTACSKSATASGTPHALTVSVRDNTFSPPADSINAGDSVTFTWQGSQMHDLIFQDSVHVPNVSTPQTAGSVKRGFASPGIYKYRCTIHSSDFNTGTMIGTIAVY
ncbi:MAG TPA: cupredoxin domain-containing protein [Gemmatimonadales bacterium]|nr:cupredoxin domain-containing protein [Gemmatimonadales bacterium]